MTDSHTPNSAQPSSTPASTHQPSQSSGSQYEGFDPELPEHDKETGKTAKVSTIQVGASAAAAVTSAVFASFFGVAGTLIGAAVGSIVSTIAGAFYADYMRRASKVVKNTTTVVVQRIPPDRLATSPLRRLAETQPVTTRATDPAAVPPTQSLQPVDMEAADETVVVPVESGTELLAAVDDATSTMPAVDEPTYGTAEPQPEQPKPWWRRRAVTGALIGVAGFAIALGVITGTELVLKHPLAGGTGGTTLSSVGKSSAKKSSTSTPTSTVTVTETATASPTASATTEPSATATTAPSATATTAPSASATTAPSATATTAPSVTQAPATDSAGGADALATDTP